MKHPLGFILLRHVNCPDTNRYWLESYQRIRSLYPTHPVVIIDDNSDYNHIKPRNFQSRNCQIVQSEFKGRGEILPYYYFYREKYFLNAVIIHDSVFLHERMQFTPGAGGVRFFWDFDSTTALSDNKAPTKACMAFIETMDTGPKEDLTCLLRNPQSWRGCFGVMSVISHAAVETLATKYKFFDLLHTIERRKDREVVERIFGLLCYYANLVDRNSPSLLGDIHTYCTWGYTYQEYLRTNRMTTTLPLVKVWTGR